MEFWKFVIRILAMLAMSLFVAAPFVWEYITFRLDKKKKLTHKRFRMVLYTAVFLIVCTFCLSFYESILSWFENISYVQWLVRRLAPPERMLYALDVVSAILLNGAVAFVYVYISKLVRIGLKEKDLVNPAMADGKFSFAQKIERMVLRFFNKESWFFVADVIKCISVVLSVLYTVAFTVYLIPAMFGNAWIPYNVISMLFECGYLYPVITLIPLWEMYFFLEGVKRINYECKLLISNEEAKSEDKETVDLNEIDAEIRMRFGDHYVCDVDLSAAVSKELTASVHHPLTELIGKAVENDSRNICKRNETYLNCIDRIVETDNSILINGSFFSGFSVYFLRYLSVVIARGDNVVVVCNTDDQIDSAYNYLVEGLSSISSMYCSDFSTETPEYDDPVWKISKISGEASVIDEATVDDRNVLVTSLGYLCSSRFEKEHSRFIPMINTVVFVDTVNTVNKYNRQLAILNTRLRQAVRTHSLAKKNGNVKEVYKARYMARQIRYICFDNTRVPELDRMLKNMLAVNFDSADAMSYSSKVMVRCYNYDGKTDENGQTQRTPLLNSEEKIGVVMNMAVLCLAKGASDVTVFADDVIPYESIAEIVAANAGQLSVSADVSSIKINRLHYNADKYSVVIVMNSGDNIPATIRKHISALADKPALVIVFSGPGMMRDYYNNNIDKIWVSTQIERIPVEEGTKKDISQRILVRANAGGITKNEIISLASAVPQFAQYVKTNNVDAILREILEVYGISTEDTMELYRYFEYSSVRGFNEAGKYVSADMVVLRSQGKLFDMINGRDMIVMVAGEKEILLPMPKSRLSQNYIEGQNLVYNGNIYQIKAVDNANGRLYVQLAMSGRNNEVYRYSQVREYRIEKSPEQIEYVMPVKHNILNRENDGISVSDVYISCFRAPVDVVTRGYFDVDPRTLSAHYGEVEYYSISDEGDDELAKKNYRRYGEMKKPAYSSDSIMQSANLISSKKGALTMSVKICGEFGPDINKTMTLAAVMLNELIHSMFPSVADSVVVCPVLRGEFEDDESRLVLQTQPRLIVNEQDMTEDSNTFELMIIEDCATDLGVISVLTSSGVNAVHTLFGLLFMYLEWYINSESKSKYLWFGLDHQPECFDFSSLHKLSKILGDTEYSLNFVDLEDIAEYENCSFCGKRCNKSTDISVLDDGRKMCTGCAGILVGNNKKILKEHLERAAMYLESTYGVALDNDYEFCFESTMKIVNMLRQNQKPLSRGADLPLKSYTDDKNKVYVEYALPSVNLSELLVRELTYIWQAKHLEGVSQELTEGHVALVVVQYLRFLECDSLADVRSTYYESAGTVSGEGYRKMVRELLLNTQFNNNPFRYLAEISGANQDEKIIKPVHTIALEGECGLPYTPEKPDRDLSGKITYFYYSNLNEAEKTLYDILLNAINEHKDNVTVTGYSFELVCNILDAIEYDHPEIFWYKTISMIGDEVRFVYGATVEETQQLQKRIDEAVSVYLDGIDDTMSAYDVALRIHMKVINKVDYDTIALNRQKLSKDENKDKIDYLRSVCGVFLDGKAVCEGYARAIQYLLQKCGIECAEVAGYVRKETGEKGVAHAWNIIKIDGDYYYMDTTWDDSSNTVQTVKKREMGFNYFCITTEELTRTRNIDLVPVQMPVCSAVKANYFYHNNLVLDEYNVDKIKEIAIRQAKNKMKSFTVKCATKQLFDCVMNELCVDGHDCFDILKAASKADKQISPASYSYSYDKNIFTVKIIFKYK